MSDRTRRFSDTELSGRRPGEDIEEIREDIDSAAITDAPRYMEDDCPRCNTGLKDHTCWSLQVQELPPLHKPRPVKLARPAK